MPDNVTPFEKPPVRGFLHRPAAPAGPGLALTHGAGGNATGALQLRVADAFCAAGFYVLRFDLPFRQRRPYGPPHPSTAAGDRAGVRAAIEALRTFTPERIFAGGQSYGGRQATYAATEDPRVCDGLLLLSYPLHPPNKPQQLRTDHFPALRTPALFVHGARDPFGSPEEISAALELIPSPTQLVFVDGAGHDLNHGKFDIETSVVQPFQRLMQIAA